MGLTNSPAGATRYRSQHDPFREAEGTAAEPVLGPGSRMCPIRVAGSPRSASVSPGAAVPAVSWIPVSWIPAQPSWARRSRASRCPSGGRSEICLPCGWQHSPSSEACSCQVRPSQHQPWLVSTCSVTAHPFSPRALLSVCVYPGARRRTHLKPLRRAGGWTTVGDSVAAPCSPASGVQPTKESLQLSAGSTDTIDPGGPPLLRGSGC